MKSKAFLTSAVLRDIRARRAGGFTVVEMLIVVAIIGLLAALIFPVLGRAREAGRARACTSNLRQLGLAFEQYTQDAARKYPGPGNYQDWGGPPPGQGSNSGHWISGVSNAPVAGSTTPFDYISPAQANIEQGALYPYVKNSQVYICPSNRDGGKKKFSYSMNCAVGGMSNVRIRQPAEIVLLVDETYANDGFFWAPADGSFWPAGNTGYTTSTDAMTQIHNGGGNLLFTDGHVKFYSAQAFPVDATPAGLANKARQTGTPRFHDRAFGKFGSNYIEGKAVDLCLTPMPTPVPGG